jgi:hypothetical protein
LNLCQLLGIDVEAIAYKLALGLDDKENDNNLTIVRNCQ